MQHPVEVFPEHSPQECPDVSRGRHANVQPEIDCPHWTQLAGDSDAAHWNIVEGDDLV